MRSAQKQIYQSEWERTRWLAAVMLSPYSKQPINPQKLITFGWEKSEVLTIFEAVDKYKSIFDKLKP